MEFKEQLEGDKLFNKLKIIFCIILIACTWIVACTAFNSRKLREDNIPKDIHDTIFNMRIGEIFILNKYNGVSLTRVPNGWIYESLGAENTIFIEYTKQHEKELEEMVYRNDWP